MERYIFIGNRFCVLKRMISLGCNIAKIYVVKNSFLEDELKNSSIDYEIIVSRDMLIQKLTQSEFEILVSNGCPYILPISKLRNGIRKFVNIHPSLLPELRGKHPINGALLFGKRHGVTCHHMSDNLDDGDICAQIEIPISEEIDLELLYQVSFFAEGKVFEDAYKSGFAHCIKQSFSSENIYYNRKEADRQIQRLDSLSLMLSKIRAFSTDGQYAYMMVDGKEIKIKAAKIIHSCLAKEMYSMNKLEQQDCLRIGSNKVLICWGDELVELEIV